jgi:hypothetical protein
MASSAFLAVEQELAAHLQAMAHWVPVNLRAAVDDWGAMVAKRLDLEDQLEALDLTLAGNRSALIAWRKGFIRSTYGAAHVPDSLCRPWYFANDGDYQWALQMDAERWADFRLRRHRWITAPGEHRAVDAPQSVAAGGR